MTWSKRGSVLGEPVGRFHGEPSETYRKGYRDIRQITFSSASDKTIFTIELPVAE